MDRLSLFVSHQLKRRFAWGVDDCVTFPADWLVENGHADPMGDLRGSYATAASCQRATGFFTDPVGAVAGRMAGLLAVAPDGQPERGDVGVVLFRSHGISQFHGAIHLDDGLWVARDITGLGLVDSAKVLAAWRSGADLQAGVAA
ncbi:MAG: hypothetical protein KBF85_06550 [Tabrizicola sp.]|nr:hypothetical protein [Tabrizicola sp.]